MLFWPPQIKTLRLENISTYGFLKWFQSFCGKDWNLDKDIDTNICSTVWIQVMLRFVFSQKIKLWGHLAVLEAWAGIKWKFAPYFH